MSLRIDRFAYLNKLYHVHPAEKFAFALVTMIICLALSTPITSFLVILLMAGLVIFAARIPALFYLRLMFLPMFFLVAGVLTVALSFSPKDTYPFLWGFKLGGYTLGVTATSLATAQELFLKSLGAVSCLYFLSLTTPMVEILTVLKNLKLPSLFIELMTLIYRFIFVLLETTDKILISQSSRGGYATVKTSYFSLGQLGANLFTKSYHHSQMLFTALLARCYQGNLNVLEKSYPLSGKNLAMFASVELILLALGLWLKA
ncbi:MAG: cobalt ECF transporter T component CbiQ [Peptococcaceae bacterium]